MTWKQAPFNPLRVFKPNGTAITVWGTNRYTGQPVNTFGLTPEADTLRDRILTEFPASPTKQNYAVDRKVNHATDPDAPLSDHARGEALDWMVARYDHSPGIGPLDRDYGNALVAWLDTQMTGPVQRGLRDRSFVGPYRIGYWVWNGEQHLAGKGRRPLKPTSNQHRDHVHVSVVPVDRSRRDGKDPRRTLRFGTSGADVKFVQRVVGTHMDGEFRESTMFAVQAWQMGHGLVADGVVGPKTWAVIDVVTLAQG